MRNGRAVSASAVLPAAHQMTAHRAGVLRAPSARMDYLGDPRLALTEIGVVCLECGRSFRHLTNTHLRKHGLTSDEYKRRFGYNARRALMIPLLRRRHSDNANRLGLARRIRRRPILESVELRRMGGRHPHALEERLTRRDRHRRPPSVQAFRDGRGRFASVTRAAPVFL